MFGIKKGQAVKYLQPNEEEFKPKPFRPLRNRKYRQLLQEIRYLARTPVRAFARLFLIGMDNNERIQYNIARHTVLAISKRSSVKRMQDASRRRNRGN